MQEIPYYQNFDLTSIETPIKADQLTSLLMESNYDAKKSQFLIEGFTKGFDLGYTGPKIRQDSAKNLPFNVGNKFILWDKIMKEVKIK